MSKQMQQGLRNKIGKAIDEARRAWAVAMFMISVAVGVFAPLWCLLLMIPFGMITYYMTISFASAALAKNLSPEELQELINADPDEEAKLYEASKNEPEEEVEEKLPNSEIHDHVTIEDMGPVIGHYLDNKIYEYILVKIPNSQAVEKLPYFGPAEVKKGIPQIPTFDDMIVACVDFVLYAKETQPAQ